MKKISLKQAKNLVLQKQLLDDPASLEGKEGTYQAIDRLGYVQIDTINIIERAHHVALNARVSGYRQQYLHQLQKDDRRIFEYWAHAASYLPMKDYRYYISHMQGRRSKYISSWIKGKKNIIDRVKKRVTEEGPLSGSDFEGRNKRKGVWWDWKPEKMALEVLFLRGELMVSERKNFKRIYDLTERVLPQGMDISMPGEREEKQFFIKRALGSMGPASEGDIDKYMHVTGRLCKWLKELEEAGDIQGITIEGLPKKYFILTEDLAGIEGISESAKHQVHLLSPFDNLVILRNRIREMFDFEYTLECYVPAAKRKYGYFSLPILWKGELVGRLDPKADRQNKQLIINSLFIEKRIIGSDEFFSALARRLKEFAAFNKCDEVTLIKTYPEKYGKTVQRHLK
ncbi:MAG: crosslink repair DNA glycosylase YcaQ family protein [Candidatus Edwardsbacteria bacterium]|nr:crosslink repair DNA glycosylase YcaQ family protein [Candidatus Edwardsbacteria bacterium]